TVDTPVSPETLVRSTNGFANKPMAFCISGLVRPETSVPTTRSSCALYRHSRMLKAVSSMVNRVTCWLRLRSCKRLYSVDEICTVEMLPRKPCTGGREWSVGRSTLDGAPASCCFQQAICDCSPSLNNPSLWALANPRYPSDALSRCQGSPRSLAE